MANSDRLRGFEPAMSRIACIAMRACSRSMESFLSQRNSIRAQNQARRMSDPGCIWSMHTRRAPCAIARGGTMEVVRNDDRWLRLHERLQGIARRRAELDAEEARCLREAHDLKLWRRLGYAHMNEYLERELGYAPQAGIERLRIAQALATLPQIEARLGDGSLAYSAVRELTRVATADTELDWLAKARGKNLREIEAMVSGRKRGDRPTDPKNPDLVKRVLRLELSPAAFAPVSYTHL